VKLFPYADSFSSSQISSILSYFLHRCLPITLFPVVVVSGLSIQVSSISPYHVAVAPLGYSYRAVVGCFLPPTSIATDLDVSILVA